jgi:tRNA threonylcarbamoyladenosine biosynthesis protein TsaB
MALSSFLNPVKLLAIEASTDICSLALSDGTTLFLEEELTPKAHTKVLLSLLDRLLDRAKLVLTDCDAFAFGCGPGSFTGVRIACSVVQALAYAVNKPVIPISTLKILAQGAYRKDYHPRVMACLGAKRSEKYGGLFVADQNGIMQAESPEWVKRNEEIILPSADWTLVENDYPSAADLMLLAIEAYHQGKTKNAAEVEPVYLSLSTEYLR